MFELALKADITCIGVQTDDPVNFPKVLEFFAGKKVVELPHKMTGAPGPYLYYTDDEKLITPALYEKFQHLGLQIVVQNAGHGNPLIFDAGIFPTPEPLVRALLVDMLKDVNAEFMESLLLSLRGLSLKSIRDVLLLTEARTGAISVPEIRRTRASMFGGTTGLHLEDTTYDFYDVPKDLNDWLQLNAQYFHKKVHAKLVPRGLMFEGEPGTGKTMAAKYIANTLGVPLYSFDITDTLDKFQGVSENRMSNILGLIDREAPCVILFDEVEKVFQSTKDETGTISRMLSRLLKWMSDHQSRVFVVMTTNDKSGLPKELYRKGRIDEVFYMAPLPWDKIIPFASRCFEAVTGRKLIAKESAQLRKVLKEAAKIPGNELDLTSLPHGTVAGIVYEQIKIHGWI